MTALPVPADLAEVVAGSWVLDGGVLPRGLPQPAVDLVVMPDGACRLTGPETCSRQGTLPTGGPLVGVRLRPGTVTAQGPSARTGRLRRLVARAFTPRAIGALLPSIEETVRGQLSDVDGELDVIGRLGAPLPVRTIAALLGVDADRQPDFLRWTEAITSYAGSFARDPVHRNAFQAAQAELAEYFRDLFADRRARPRGDVVDTLLAADPDGGRLSDGELLNFCTLLLINGHETTGTLLVNAVLGLTAHPDALAGLRADPGQVPAAVEEVLRFLPPTGGTDRFTTGSVSIGGHTVAAGGRVIAMMLSANRDPRVFTDPDSFRPGRTPNEHLSFGHGVHFCLGAHLARHEVAIALRALLQRFPGPWSTGRITTRRTPVGIDVLDLVLAGR
jgi:cytochrome P450